MFKTAREFGAANIIKPYLGALTAKRPEFKRVSLHRRGRSNLNMARQHIRDRHAALVAFCTD